jgi:hypothetical protein
MKRERKLLSVSQLHSHSACISFSSYSGIPYTEGHIRSSSSSLFFGKFGGCEEVSEVIC